MWSTALPCLAVISAIVPGMAWPQTQIDGSITIDISLTDGVDSSFRLYGEREHLEFDVLVESRSQSEAPVFVDQEVLRRVFAIRVELDGTEIPVDVHWPDEVSVQDRSEIVTGITTGIVTRFPWWQPVQLNPHEAVWFKVTLERQDRPHFEEGRYDVVFAVAAFETAIRRVDGTAWRGYTNANRRIQRVVTIQRPRNAEEQLAAHMADATLALGRGDRQASLEALLKALAVDPGNGYVRQRLGLAYLGLGRYQEAVQVYESLIGGVAAPGRVIARDLAKAYLGVGDEGNAVRVLRMSGVSKEAMRDEIRTLRSGLR